MSGAQSPRRWGGGRVYATLRNYCCNTLLCGVSLERMVRLYYRREDRSETQERRRRIIVFVKYPLGERGETSSPAISARYARRGFRARWQWTPCCGGGNRREVWSPFTPDETRGFADCWGATSASSRRNGDIGAACSLVRIRLRRRISSAVLIGSRHPRLSRISSTAPSRCSPFTTRPGGRRRRRILPHRFSDRGFCRGFAGMQ